MCSPMTAGSFTSAGAGAAQNKTAALARMDSHEHFFITSIPFAGKV
jgi:hypothetical protein